LTYLEVSFAEPVPFRSLALPPVESLLKRRNFYPASSIPLEAYCPTGWKLVGERQIPRGTWQDRQLEMSLVLAFSDVFARRFRLTFDNRYPLQLDYLQLSSAARTNDWRGQAGYALRSQEKEVNLIQNPQAWVAAEDILDVSEFLEPDGKLRWKAPKGNWTIVRFGHVNTGVKNKPAPPEATGFECDKLSPKGAERHFAGYIGRLTEKGGPIAGQLQGMLIDSWECYTQTWTPVMESEFTTRRGYPLRKWLPALAGWIIDDPLKSERFLRDWRATISDLLVENYFGHLAKLGRERGLKLSFETALGDVSPGDILQYYAAADVPMCEFWQPNDPHWGGFETKPIHPAVSAAHIYGKPVIAAEAFTNVGIRWNEHPFMLKHRADQHFALGVNHLIFHTYTHNPRLDVVPGTSFGSRIGTPFLRGQTWWKYMPQFTDYLARCEFLLQQGLPVTDVLWYLGDDLDHKPRQDHPFPAGYKFDYVNFDALMHRIEVRNGRLSTPEGNSWRVLWLPQSTCSGMTVKTLKRIQQLLTQGATVIGPPPTRNPSLSGGMAADAEFSLLIAELWGASPGKTGHRQIGAGKLLWGQALGPALANLGIAPDLPQLTSVGWYHRRSGGRDIYFLSADRIVPLRGNLRFRTQGTPELWDPMTGEVHQVPLFKREGEYTSVPIDLPAAGSAFLVFRNREDNPRWQQVTHHQATLFNANDQTTADIGAPYPFAGLTPEDTLQPWLMPADPHAEWGKNGEALLVWKEGAYAVYKPDGTKHDRQANGIQVNHLDRDWDLSFPSGWGASERISLDQLTSWTKLDAPADRAFSGTATYRKMLTIEALAPDSRFLLDLGKVANLAEIHLNGQLVARLWAPPFRADITSQLKLGDNELEITVTNTWHNRLVYDANLPEADRKTWTIHAPRADATLEPAGLLGPVRLYEGKVLSLKD
ncbi:MAG: glycosyl hydrolase, partial [Bacteroidota bacterium]